MKLYACINFRGHWPVPTAAVIVARDEVDALNQLIDACAIHGIPQDGADVGQLQVRELDLTAPMVYLLNTGNY